MTNFLIRIATFLLVPCVVLDPVLAVARSSLPGTEIGPVTALPPFDREALAAADQHVLAPFVCAPIREQESAFVQKTHERSSAKVWDSDIKQYMRRPKMQREVNKGIPIKLRAMWQLFGHTPDSPLVQSLHRARSPLWENLKELDLPIRGGWDDDSRDTQHPTCTLWAMFSSPEPSLQSVIMNVIAGPNGKYILELHAEATGSSGLILYIEAAGEKEMLQGVQKLLDYSRKISDFWQLDKESSGSVLPTQKRQTQSA